MHDGFWLTDEQFQRLEPFLPTDTRGVARVDDRRVISGIVQVLKSGCRWKDASTNYGPHKTLYNRFVRWWAKDVWDGVQRSSKATLTEERVQRLDKIGFVWNALSANWEEGFAALEVFKEREGHCRVPHSHKEGDHSLGSWVSNQREKKATLTQERLQRLDKIDVVWNARKLESN